MVDELWILLTAGLIVAAAGMVAYGFYRDQTDPYSSHRLAEIVKRVTHESAQQAVRILELETLLAEHEAGHAANARRMAANNIPLAWKPKRTAKAVMNGGSKLLPLYDLLYERFSDDELYDLGFRIGIKRDEIVGETHSAKAQCLIEYAARHELVDDLIVAGREVRPDLRWPEVNL